MKNTYLAKYLPGITLITIVTACGSSKPVAGNAAAQAVNTQAFSKAPTSQQTQNTQPPASGIRMEAKEIKEVK